MKKILATLSLSAIVFTSVHAQEIPERKDDGYKPHAKEKMHRKKEMMDLGLTEEQKTKFKTLNKEHHQQLADLKKQDNITVKEQREKMEAIRKEHHEKTQAIFTPEQKDKMAKAKESRKVKMQDMEKKRGERMKKELNLTDEQSAKLSADRKVVGEKMKSIREDKSLSDEQKKEKSKELMKEHRDKMKSIYTEEQLKKLEERKKNHDRKPGKEAKDAVI